MAIAEFEQLINMTSETAVSETGLLPGGLSLTEAEDGAWFVSESGGHVKGLGPTPMHAIIAVFDLEEDRERIYREWIDFQNKEKGSE